EVVDDVRGELRAEGFAADVDEVRLVDAADEDISLQDGDNAVAGAGIGVDIDELGRPCLGLVAHEIWVVGEVEVVGDGEQKGVALEDGDLGGNDGAGSAAEIGV